MLTNVLKNPLCNSL